MSYDITLCAGGDCSIKQFCYRHTAEILGRQNFFGNLPCDTTKNTYEYFLKNEFYEELIRQRAYQIWEKNGRKLEDGFSNWEQAEDEFFGKD